MDNFLDVVHTIQGKFSIAELVSRQKHCAFELRHTGPNTKTKIEFQHMDPNPNEMNSNT